ncbi:MAG: hypothetical protein R3293_24970 [Candidatus Promineifilaceae bacterium]|nr:hypothetical protein [Candidatus Promineifilaceae bacterium]
MKAQTRMITGSFAILIAGIAAVSLVMAGSGRAQTSQPAQTQQSEEPQQVKKVETVREIIMEGEPPEEWVAFPFEAALGDLVDDDRLTVEEKDRIMAILSEKSDAVTYESSTSGDDLEQDVEVLVEIKIDDDGRDFTTAFEQTLDQVVAENLLTAEEAAAILANLE